jgi:hypothetical protein
VAFYGDHRIFLSSFGVNHFQACLEVSRIYGQSTSHDGGVYDSDVAKGQAFITLDYVCCLVMAHS